MNFNKFFVKIFGSRNERLLKKYWRVVDDINSHEAKVSVLSDEQLRERTLELHEGVMDKKLSSEQVMPEAFAIIREAMADATDVVFAGRAVVMDRCFASTASYGAAEKGEVATLADVLGNMPSPDHVFFLSLEEGERRPRIEGRGDVRTGEESRLSHDAEFRGRVIDGYLALGVRSVDASGPVGEVVGAIVAMVQNAGQTGTVAGSEDSGQGCHEHGG